MIYTRLYYNTSRQPVIFIKITLQNRINLIETSYRPGAAKRYTPADGSSTRGGSTSVRGKVRSPHISGGRPAAGSQRAYSLSSCATQPACYGLGWDRQMDRRTDRGIA